MIGWPNFSVERMAAGGACSQFRAPLARRHRSPLRSPHMRAQRAKLKSCREDMKIAQGKRGTSAALGCGPNMNSSPFHGPSRRSSSRRDEPEGASRRFAPRGAGAWAALARSGLLPACKEWRSRRASCWLTLTSFTVLGGYRSAGDHRGSLRSCPLRPTC